jgi:hypothetical protein
VRSTLLLPKPSLRIDVEELFGPAGALLQISGERRQQFQTRCSQLVPKA